MSTERAGESRVVQAVHGNTADPADMMHQVTLVDKLKQAYSTAGLLELYGRFAVGQGFIDSLMRAAILQGLAYRCGAALQVETGAAFKHPETFDIGDNVFIGAQACIQGRFDGSCVIGNHVWIGPMAFLDARDLVIGDFVGWGPGAKVLGSTHTGRPSDIPIIRTDLEIKPVRIDAWADIGTGATILPGVRVGKGAIVGAGAVVVSDVEPYAVVAGVPAKFLRWRAEGSGGR